MKMDLSDLPIAPHQYRLAGIILLVLGALILILGIVFAFGAAQRSAVNKNYAQVSADECVKRISELGLKAIAADNKIQIAEPHMTQAVALLAQSSQAISLCPEWKLTQYCLGIGCRPQGLTMTLQYHEPKN